MNSLKMTRNEKKAIFSLSSIMGLRILGLFMVLPVFTLYAQHLQGATPALIGLAIGVYGLCQAIFQIPFGSLSDYFGRKRIIFAGLVIFAAGSLVAGFAHSITFMIIGRALQGLGAIGSSIMAMIADNTREEQRSKAMALSGASIGLAFMLAMLTGPILASWFNVSGLFFIASLLALAAMVLLFTLVPDTDVHSTKAKNKPGLATILRLAATPELAKLNLGIFSLHAIFTASFIVIPISLSRFAGLASRQQWQLYIPVLILSFILSLACIGIAERKKVIKPFFLAAIVCMLAAEGLLIMAADHYFVIPLGLCLFFAGFSLLEAFLPSLVSRAAPAEYKGSAMGIFSCSQYLGIFVGGTIGGWLYGSYSFTGVYLFCMMLALVWFALAANKSPNFISTEEPLQSNTII